MIAVCILAFDVHSLEYDITTHYISSPRNMKDVIYTTNLYKFNRKPIYTQLQDGGLDSTQILLVFIFCIPIM